MADFNRCVGGLGIFVQDGDSVTGVLQLLHGLQSYSEAHGRSRDRVWSFGYEGDVEGMGIITITFDREQLTITAEGIVTGTIRHVRQLLSEDPIAMTLAPFFTSDVNTCTTKTGKVAYFPVELMELLLGSNLTERQVYQLVVSALLETGIEVTCSGFIDFLTAALDAPSVAAPPPLTVHQ
jgi:hypothetical protein